jgi:polyhydroxyalkanoate synthase subunit PhaC
LDQQYFSTNFIQNLSKISSLYQDILSEFMNKHLTKEILEDQRLKNFTHSFNDVMNNFYADPEKIMAYQMEYTKNYFTILQNISSRLLGNQEDPAYEIQGRDNRFKDNIWNHNLMFSFIKQCYLMNGQHMQNIIQDFSEGMPEHKKLQAFFFARQIIDAFSPTNFATTNPRVVSDIIESHGENLLHGLERMKKDMANAHNFLNFSTSSDQTAFSIGKNLAITKGNVVFQNKLIQLIHYTPAKANNYSIPLLVIPPWINKYYILDLQPENSYIKWLVSQGYSVFLVSWVNPDKHYAKTSFEDYMQLGILDAIDFITEKYNVKSVNTIGYCIGGTLLACALSYMASNNIKKVNSATFLTTLLDFRNSGDLLAFIDEEQIKAIEEKMAKNGFYDGYDMGVAFNLIRSNEMIWSFFINHYLLGKESIPFDLLYWNADHTRMPAKMHSFYLRNMYLNNLLAKKDGITLLHTPIDLSKINVPCYFLSTCDDHIAPWKATFEATNLISKSIEFVLGGSGHIAGVVNHPDSKKYFYYTRDIHEYNNADDWLAGAVKHEGSWWNNWHEWQKKLSGKEISAQLDENLKITAIEAAPGSYVVKKYK